MHLATYILKIWELQAESYTKLEFTTGAEVNLRIVGLNFAQYNMRFLQNILNTLRKVC